MTRLRAICTAVALVCASGQVFADTASHNASAEAFLTLAHADKLGTPVYMQVQQMFAQRFEQTKAPESKKALLETYQAKALNSGISVINSIRFSNPLVGYITAELGGAGTVYRSHDAGYSWQNNDPDIDGIPTVQRFNFAAPCGVNEVAAGGRVSVAGDGLLALAT